MTAISSISVEASVQAALPLTEMILQNIKQPYGLSHSCIFLFAVAHLSPRDNKVGSFFLVSTGVWLAISNGFIVSAISSFSEGLQGGKGFAACSTLSLWSLASFLDEQLDPA
jgi:hypothetical protein